LLLAGFGYEGFSFANLFQSESTKSALPSFWVPSLTPGTDADEITANKAVKLTPICPGSTDENRHPYSLKSLVDVNFTEEKASDGTASRICPSCKKNLSNGLKAMRMLTQFEPDWTPIHGLVSN
jgi:nitric oxide synthase-interacting protein